MCGKGTILRDLANLKILVVENNKHMRNVVVELLRALGTNQILEAEDPLGGFSLIATEDIDLVQITSGPIGETFDALRAALDPWLGEPRRVLKEGRVNLVYRFASEQVPARPMRLKIEINSREHFSELGHTHHPFSVSSRWWSGAANVTSFELDELLGTKLRALFQRKKGRDLFDLWYAIDGQASSPERIVACFDRYMRESGNRVSRAVFEENLAKKLTDSVFRADMTPLLRPGLSWDIDRAGDTVKKELITRLPGDPWRMLNP